MFKPHALAAVLPAMSGEDYERLRTDIAENGLNEPITLYEGKVLDGIHRQRACDETGVPLVHEEFSGDNPAAFVFSQNVARRHLTVGQRAMFAAKLPSRPEGRAEKSTTGNPVVVPSLAETAAAAGVDPSTVSQARRVTKERPDLGKKVEDGKMSLNAAYEEMTGRHTGGNGPRRTKSWNGKTNPTREREIRATQKNGDKPRPDNYNELLRLSLDMNRACSIIESYHVEDFDLEVTTLDLVDTFHDDLITLMQWVDQAMMRTQAWLGDVKVRRKIEALRNTTGRTPEETESFHRLADKLERKLEAVLPSGV